MEFPIHLQQIRDLDVEQALVLLQIGQDHIPIFGGQPGEHDTIELVMIDALLGVAQVDRTAGSQREQIATRIRRLQVLQAP